MSGDPLAQHFPFGTGAGKRGRVPNIDRDIDRYRAAQEREEREAWQEANRIRKEREAALKAASGDGTPIWKLRLATVIKRSGATTPEDIAATTAHHREIIVNAIRAGKHVPDTVMLDHTKRGA